MDVVYLVKPSERNEEIRWSLRSLKNLPHDRVFFSGYMPSWVRNVTHIPVFQLPGQKHANSIRNQRAALEHPEVSDPFILFNDDHFVMKPQTHMPVLNWGLVRDVLDGGHNLGQVFRRSMQWTHDILRDELGYEPLSYQLHVPLVWHKDQILRTFDTYSPFAPPGINPHYVTIAGNRFGWGGRTLTEDVKLLRAQDPITDRVRNSDFLSTSDVAFEGHPGIYIRGQFPKRSIYES